ncbi:hypothetical protein GCM10027612_45100 [Microbispora bryophytorum subsp. camponoti]
MDLLDVLEFLFVVGALAGGQQSRGDGLMGDERADLARVIDGQVEADGGAEAAAEHERRRVGEAGQQPMHVVGVLGHGRPVGGVVQGAA